MKSGARNGYFGKICSLFLFLFLAGAVSSFAAITLNQTKNAEGNDQIAIENAYFSMVITPARGGMVTSFTHKKTGNQWVLPDPSGQGLSGIFGDHLIQPPAGMNSWPGECMSSGYEYKVLKNTPEETVIKLWHRMKEDESMPAVAGLLVEKEITVKDALPYVICKIRVANDTKVEKSPQYWMQQCMVKVGKTKDKNYYYRPSARGIRVGFWESTWPTKVVKGEEYIKDPAAGWLGTVNSKDKEGLVCLMDYNYLDWLYNCITYNTIEWFYQRLSLKPGESWNTEIIFRPTFGFTGCSHASRNVICDTRPEITDAVLKITQAIASTEKEVADKVTCRMKILSFPERKQLAEQTETFDRLGSEPESRDLDFGKIASDRLLLIDVEISGKSFKDLYEIYYDSASKEKAYYGLTDYQVQPPARKNPLAAK